MLLREPQGRRATITKSRLMELLARILHLHPEQMNPYMFLRNLTVGALMAKIW